MGCVASASVLLAAANVTGPKIVTPPAPTLTPPWPPVEVPASMRNCVPPVVVAVSPNNGVSFPTSLLKTTSAFVPWALRVNSTLPSTAELKTMLPLAMRLGTPARVTGLSCPRLP